MGEDGSSRAAAHKQQPMDSKKEVPNMNTFTRNAELQVLGACSMGGASKEARQQQANSKEVFQKQTNQCRGCVGGVA